jgi:hypothetical protein
MEGEGDGAGVRLAVVFDSQEYVTRDEWRRARRPHYSYSALANCMALLSRWGTR